MQNITVAVRDGMFTTHLLKGGAGAPLVYLHGAGGLRAGSPWLDALAQYFTVYAPWHPGWGASQGLEQIDDIRDLATYYQDLFDTLAIERPVVVGHSFGGMVAAEIAAQCRQAISRLVLAAPVGLWRDDVPIPDIFTMSPQDTARLAFADAEGALAQQFGAMPEEPEQLATMMIERTQSLAAAGKFMWPFPEKGLHKRIHRITTPTLIIWGESDRLVPPAYAREFHSRIAGATLVMLKDAGHMAPLEQPEQFVKAVRDFAGERQGAVGSG